MSGARFGIDAGGAYGAMGYIAGLTREVQTTGYINSVLNYTHATLSQFFDEWMDALARIEPRSFQHVYEWPSQFQQYHETVGVAQFRLWKNVLRGHGREKEASFRFLASKRPSPVDPILLIPGTNGETVKEHVHIFVLKAQAMEYGMDITVTPKLAKYLAYVGRLSQQGRDEGWHHVKRNADGSAINFSEGPVHFTAGGGVAQGKFTSAFVTWWQTQAGAEFDSRIAPTLQRDIEDRSKMDAAIRVGRRANKSMTLNAAPGANARTFEEAQALAIAQMRANEGKYINQAAARRNIIYGD